MSAPELASSAHVGSGDPPFRDDPRLIGEDRPQGRGVGGKGEGHKIHSEKRMLASTV